MASSMRTLAFAVLCLLLISEMGLPMAEAVKADCQDKCVARCSKSLKPKNCIMTCNACCQRCNSGCMPSGTTADRDVCICNVPMKALDSKYKCP